MHPIRATIAALSANLVAIGLARFGYTPLIPALIGAHWFSPAAAAYLGAANLAGYLAGALAARRVGAALGVATTLRAAMALTTASLFACAFPLGFGWFFFWRVASGGTGGVIMVLAAPIVLAQLPPERRAIAGGAIFTGVGIGIAASGTLVPEMMRWGVAEAWFGLATLALVLTAATWRGWPKAAMPARREHGPMASWPIRSLYLEYALNAVGLVPHMVFLVDFIARGLDRGLAVGGRYWVVFGLGALVGPMIGGHAGGRIGFRATLRATFLLQALCIALPLASVSPVALTVSSLVVGATVPGIVAITIGRSHELIPGDPARQAAAWGWCTIAFSIGLAVASYGFSYIFAHTADGYPILFALGAVAMLSALAIDFAATLPGRHRSAAASQ